MIKYASDILGPPLFHDLRAPNRMLGKLPREAGRFLARRRKETPYASPADLRAALYAAFPVEPLEIGDLQTIKFEMFERHHLNEYRCPMWRHLAEAVVDYSGHPMFLKWQPAASFSFGFRGNIGTSTFRMRALLDGKDFDYFERIVEEALDEARKALNRAAGEQTLIGLRAGEILDHVFKETISC